MKLGDYLDQLCWSQKDLARESGVSSSSIGRALAGDKLSRRTAQAIVQALAKATNKPLTVKDVTDLRIVHYKIRRRASGSGNGKDQGTPPTPQGGQKRTRPETEQGK